MNAESNKLRATLVDQLSNFESRLDDKIDDVEMLADIQQGIGRLLGSGDGSEAEIRRILQERYDSGVLRKETFQLVKSMLDRYVTEIVETSPSIAEASAVLEGKQNVVKAPISASPPAAPAGDDPMSSTVVLPAVDGDDAAEVDGLVQVGSVLRDRFMLQQRVSGGGMSVVYKALDRRLAEAASGDSWVAIKVLAPQLSRNGKALRALQQEAAKGRSLIHPNIVRFIDLDREDDLYFIVMEWIEGRTLADILDSSEAKSIDKDRAFKIARQVGKALEYAHKCGIVHADVKPGNVMIMPNGDAKLFDFGIARIRQQQLENGQKFDPGVLGLMTPAYSSMQVLTGETPVPSDDVFSLASLLYRLIAGFRVFGPRNAAEAADAGMKPERLEALNDAQWRVLNKALSYSRVARFDSMADFLDALDVGQAESITVDIPVPARFAETRDWSGSVGRAALGFAVLAAVAAVAANQLGYLDEFKARYLQTDPAESIVEGPTVEEFVPRVNEDEIVATPAEESEISSAADAVDPDAVIEELAAEPVGEIEVPEPETNVVPLVDFSALPPPDAIVAVGTRSEFPATATVTLREDGGAVHVDLIRDEIDFPRTLRVEEISHSGNRSPWSSGQYTFANNGFVEFPIGQNRARVTLEMAPDQLREADQQSTLRIREADQPSSELATLLVVLEDDEQRAFEATLPANTVAFASSQVSVNENDPAVQLDVIRFSPDDTRLVVEYSLRDITATQGEDYFAPGGYTIEFGPGQRSTRLLIPLVQDSTYEDNEAFSVELSVADSSADKGVYERVAVMIRDDDQ